MRSIRRITLFTFSNTKPVFRRHFASSEALETVTSPSELLKRKNVAVIYPVLKAGLRLTREQSVHAPVDVVPQLRLDEAVGLVEALEWDVKHSSLTPLHDITPSHFFGKGKVEEMKALVNGSGADTCFVDAMLTGTQHRNLENALGVQVVDRFGVILEIFANRAASKESKLQVELARLIHQRTRLVHRYETELAGQKQRGGTGTAMGSGETQYEMDRRTIDDRIAKIRKELEDAQTTRQVQRQQRETAGLPIVAIVGYTNAGKSALVNRVAGADLLSADKLFASLEPHLRSVTLPSGTKAGILDTVGFVADLPTPLVAAFRSTLEEVNRASVIVHVRDITHPESEFQKANVLRVLEEIQTPKSLTGNIIEVWNKTDKTDKASVDRLLEDEDSERVVFPISALRGDGVDALVSKIDTIVKGALNSHVYSVRVNSSDADALHYLYSHGKVSSHTTSEDGLTSHLDVQLGGTETSSFLAKFKALHFSRKQ